MRLFPLILFGALAVALSADTLVLKIRAAAPRELIAEACTRRLTIILPVKRKRLQSCRGIDGRLA